MHLWSELDPGGPPKAVWVRPPSRAQVTVLLGAFDPPTNAHLAVVKAAARATGTQGALCLTKVLLGRTPGDVLLEPEQRLRLLSALADEEGLAAGAINRGTYLEASRALGEAGADPVFVVGADKLPQLRDPAFYADGERGVRATFAQVRFVVVPRAGAPIPEGMLVLDPADVFDSPETAALSATTVRALARRGSAVTDFVPRVVAHLLAGYTEPRGE